MPDLLALNGQIIGGVPLPGDNYVKLWENPNPTVSFGAQTINLSSDDYDFLLVACLIKTSMNYSFSMIFPKGESIYLNFAGVAVGASATSRVLTYVNNTTYTAEVAYQATGTSASVVDNARCIPVAIYGIKKDALATEGGVVGGGHIIEDADGTDLDQQDILQFKGTLRATNDSTNGKTIVDDSAVEIEWDDWQAMSEQEREAYLAENPKVDILNFPDASGEIDVELFTKLWENPDPTAVFAAQDITLASDDYDFLMWVCTTDQIGTCGVSFISRKGSGVGLNFSSLSGNNVETYRRLVVRTSDTEFTVNTAVYNINGTSTQNNGFMIPHAIYGFKKKVTVGIDAIAEDVSTSASKCMLEDGETSVEDIITANKGGTEVNIKSYTSSNPYICPSDGYIEVNTSNGSSERGTLVVLGSNGGGLAYVNATYPTVTSLFVKKGMKVYAQNNSSNIVEVFRPIS